MEDFYETHIGWIESCLKNEYLISITLHLSVLYQWETFEWNRWVIREQSMRKKKNIHEHEEDFLAHLATLPFCLTIMLYLKLFDESFLFLLSFLSKANN